MSCTPGKIVIDGVADIQGERVFCLRFLQARNPAWVGRPFFARFNAQATWLKDLEPAFGAEQFFFQDDAVQDWRQLEPLPRTSWVASRRLLVAGSNAPAAE